MKHENRYVWLDFARGVSALIVLASHLRAALFTDFSQLESSGVLERLFYFSTSLGHQAVMVFFVLSGFFVGGSVFSKGERFKFKSYLIARLTRLWVVLIPALFFTLIVDTYIQYSAPELFSGSYFPVVNSGPAPDGSYSRSIGAFFSNMFFMQTIYSPVYGTNGPLWSLANEFWYYLLFPLLFVFLNRKNWFSKVFRVACFSMFVVALYFAKEMLLGFFIWLLGVGVYLFYFKTDKEFSSWLVVPSFLFFLLSIVDSKLIFVSEFLHISSDVVVGVAFAFLLASLKGKSVGVFKREIGYFSKNLSEISYSLYLFHFPLVLLIFVVLGRDEQMQLNAYSTLVFSSCFLLNVFVGALVWLLIERKTPMIRRYIERKLDV